MSFAVHTADIQERSNMSQTFLDIEKQINHIYPDITE